MGYDSWLVEPYERQQEEAELFYQFCEDHNLETDHPDSQVMYEDFLDQLAEEEAEAIIDRIEWERDQDYDYEY